MDLEAVRVRSNSIPKLPDEGIVDPNELLTPRVGREQEREMRKRVRAQQGKQNRRPRGKEVHEAGRPSPVGVVLDSP